MTTIKLLIADDHGLVRQSLRQYLEMEGDIEVVGEASGGDEVLDLLKDVQELAHALSHSPSSEGTEVRKQGRRGSFSEVAAQSLFQLQIVARVVLCTNR